MTSTSASTCGEGIHNDLRVITRGVTQGSSELLNDYDQLDTGNRGRMTRYRILRSGERQVSRHAVAQFGAALIYLSR